MTSAAVRMASDGDTPAAKCREARRRRIEMRQFVAVAGDVVTTRPRATRLMRREEEEEEECTGGDKRARPSSSDPPPPAQPPPPLSIGAEAPAPAAPSTSGTGRTMESPVVYGSVALAGRTREMEDAVSVRPEFFRRPGGSPVHFFAVFDGHGGSHVSALCKEWMHLLLAEELAGAAGEEADEEVRWRGAVVRSFARMDEMVLMGCACGNVGGRLCRCARTEMDSDFVGSTAVVAVVSQDRVLVANCGDSRAVLSRGGQAIPLSSDHKPDRPDELARIETAGGRVIYLNGARVHGILAMSRALGDKYLKPSVISEPEICTIGRTPEDDCLVIASDGLWDVLPNNLACDVARRCLTEGSPEKGMEDVSGGVSENADHAEGEERSDARCSLAAALLARLALGRKSNDNISVIVIDLRRS